MAVRLLAAAALATLAGCGGSAARHEVRLLAPPWIDDDVGRFERQTGCQVDLRVYDEDEKLAPIAKRRDVDVVAARATPRTGDQTEQFVHVTLAGGVDITVPSRLASAFRGDARPGPRRSIRWVVRREGDNGACARRWVAYATSQ